MTFFRRLLLLAASSALWLPFPAQAQDPEPGARAVFGFGGVMGRSHMHEMMVPFTVDYEDNFVVGGGYQHYLAHLPLDFRLGLEAGLAGRFGEAASLETWAGVVLRHDGLRIGDSLQISPSLTFGLSAVTSTMGIEREREIGDEKSANFLFYLSPEVAFSSPDRPETELFWRLHHRSSAWRTMGGGSANATTVGVRHRF